MAILFSLLLIGTQSAFTTCSVTTPGPGICLHCACGSSGNCCVEQPAPNSASSPLVPVRASQQDGQWLYPVLARLLSEPDASSIDFPFLQSALVRSESTSIFQRNCSYLI